MNARMAWSRHGSGLSDLLGGFVSYTSLWNGSTDFHTHCETVTKFEREIDGYRNGKTISLEAFLFLFLPLILSVFVSVLLSFLLCSSAAAH